MSEQEFKKIYTQYYNTVYKQCYYLVGDNGLAEDLTQEVFVKLYNSKDKVIEYPGAWLSKVAAHTALNYLRGEKRRIKREEDILSNIEEIFLLEDKVLQKEEIRRVRQVLSQMNDKQRSCLLLKFSGYSYDEIQRVTGIPKNSIGQMIARGKGNFQQAYEKEDDPYVLRRQYPSTSH
jgi:RNA polymerase sigma factor (sigma-70 family)